MTTHPLNLSTSPTNETSSLVSYDPTWTRGGKPGQLDYPRFGPELSFNGTTKGEPGEGPGQGGGRIYATDSGSSATSLACGMKTYLNAIGMDNFNRPCKNIIEKFQEKGKKTGVVTSVQFSHANDLNWAIGELFGFQEAVQAVSAWIEDPRNPQGGWDKNLLIVTADHETGYLSGIGNKGRGVIPDHGYNSKEHTNRPVGVWYQGAGMEFFQKYLKPVNDFERGEIQPHRQHRTP